MTGFLLQRLLATIPVMAVVAVVVFLLLHLGPGDPAAVIAGDYATPEDIERIRDRLGLNEPLHVQFLTWIGQVLTGDLGISIFSNLPVAQLIAQRVEPTLALSLGTLLVTVVVAVPLGVAAAWRAGAWLDRCLMGGAALAFAVPVFVIGYILIYVFAIKLAWLPVQGYSPLADGAGPFLRHLVLPVVALSFVFIALIARVTRASVLEVLGEDYIRTARAKGVTTFRLLRRHALRPALVPVVTVIGIAFALLVGGVVVTESVFNIPGLGRLTVDSVLRRDYPVIQGLILVFSAAYVITNLIVDLLYSVLDPRIRG